MPISSLERTAVYALFLLSGFSALAYEVVWERALRLSFGVSTYSVAVVTAAFMGGLSAGYAIGRSPRLARFRPLRVYAAAEAAIALYALAFPAVHAAMDAAYLASGGSIAVRAVLAFAALLPPTILMGLTLPVVVRSLSRNGSAGEAAAGLFAANTTGGVIGTLVTAWYLIRWYGAANTAGIAVIVNLAAALGALVLASRRGSEPAAEILPSRPAGVRPGPVGIALGLAAFLAGFQTMALQVVWSRTLVCVVENNTTSFSLIVASVLLGSAVGALLYASVARRIVSTAGRLRLFVAVEIFLCVYVAGSIPILNRLYDVARSLSDAVVIDGPADLLLVRLLVALIPVGPAAAAGAFLLPLLVDLLRSETDEAAAPAVSTVFAADSIGSVAGALTAGFGLIPGIGIGRSLVAMGLLAAVTAAIVLLVLRRSLRELLVGAAPLATAAVLALLVAEPLTLTRWYDGHQGVRGDLLYYREGAFGTISVFQVGDRRDLLINCIEEVPNHRDALLLFKLLGHTPLLLHPNPERVLVNALGGGITLGAVLRHPVTVEAVELVPEVRDAMALFAEENGDAASRSDWRLIHDDGRNYLRMTPERYDVITADATHPAAGESWPLYTREYYAIVSSKLAPGGIFAQWLPLHNMVDSDFLASLKTFRSAFPHMLVLFVERYSVLIGSLTPLDVDPAAIDARMRQRPDVAADLASVGVERGEDVLRYVVAADGGVDRLTEGAEILTDDHASVEFAELHRIAVPNTFLMDLEILAKGMDGAALSRATHLPQAVFTARRKLLDAKLRAADPSVDSAFAALQDLETARRLNPRDADVGVLLAELRGRFLRFLGSDYRTLLGGPDPERTIRFASYAQAIQPTDHFLNQLLGAALLRVERFTDAIPHLERAASERPDNFAYLSNLAYAYERAQRYRDALETVRRLEALDPGNPALAEARSRIEREMEER